MKKVPEYVDRAELLERVSQRINQAVYRVDVGLSLSKGEPFVKEDVSLLTTEDIRDKIRDFVESEPIDEHCIIFLHYLSNYPVSICRRNVSPVLKHLIGFHYRLGEQYKKEHYKKAKPVSMEELAQIFGRSKATIHECVSETENSWKEFLRFKEQEEEGEAIARRELIEEAKERLREEKALSEKDLDQKIQT